MTGTTEIFTPAGQVKTQPREEPAHRRSAALKTSPMATAFSRPKCWKRRFSTVQKTLIMDISIFSQWEDHVVCKALRVKSAMEGERHTAHSLSKCS
jgi:hypothetical protein